MRGMKNEKTSNEQTQVTTEFPEGYPRQQKESPNGSNAWWRSLINGKDAWETYQVSPSRHYDIENIDPRDFTGKSPKFSWE